jgi:hypothetical protein
VTKEDFNKLAPHEQEVFINQGGQLSYPPVTQQLSQSPTQPSPSEYLKGSVKANSVSVPFSDPRSSAKTENLGKQVVLSESQGCDSSTGEQPVSLSISSILPKDGFDIKDPVELLFLLDDDIQNGTVTLHDWQTQFMIDFADDRHTKEFPFKAEVRACNGSGKDKYIVASCIVWLCMRYMYARGVVTNGSGVQLDNQTEMYIRFLCERANVKFGTEVWKTNYRYYECLPTKSPITLFATDEPNKAEGYHPLVPGAKMAIFASEAKAIPDTIFTALNRCTGFSHRVDVSTPGLPMGTFHDRCSTAINRKQLEDIKAVNPVDCVEYHVTAHDCSHITKEEIETMAKEMPGGKTGAAYQSAVEAEFGTTDEMVVIPYTHIYRAFANTPQLPLPKWIPEPYNKAGLDLSDGGDETVLTVRNGNKLLKIVPFKFDNAEDTYAFLDEKFRELELTNPESFIYADVGGIGGPMLATLKRRFGWSNIRYVDNRSKAFRPKTYLNRGTELWFHTRLLLERRELILLKDDRLIKQLATRYYKIDQNNRHRLLSKLEMRSRGLHSPDRADSLVLCYWDYKSTFVESVATDESKLPFPRQTSIKPVGNFNLKNWATNSEMTRASLQNKTRQRDTSIYQQLISEHNRNLKLNSQLTEKE